MTRTHKVHTVESLKERCEEVGDCWIWNGYVSNKTPMVDVNGTMTPVRRLFTRLLGKQVKRGTFFGISCDTYLCVCPEHTVQRDRRAHTANMGRKSATGPSNQARKMKITTQKRKAGKLDMEKAREIRAKEGTYRQIAEEYGISHALVGQIKRGRYWKDYSNPFAGLGA